MANWHLIDDSQTPLSAGGFQKIAFQKCFEQNIFRIPVWISVNDEQANTGFGGFQIGDFQDTAFEQNVPISAWALVNDNQAPLIINGAFQKGPFQKCFEQGVSQLPIWIEVSDSQ